MYNALIIDADKCTSCRLCELACSSRNEGAFRPSRSRIDVAIDVDKAFYFPRVCLQCDDAPCLKECPSEAIVRDPVTNVVKIIKDQCNGCGICESACPYGVIRCVDGSASKCELCDGDPECVRFCAPGALVYEPAEQWDADRKQAYVDQLRGLRQEARP